MPKSKFDPNYWSEVIKRPDWYFEYVQFAKSAGLKQDQKGEELKKLKEQVRGFFETALQNEELALGSGGPNWDEERQPLDTIVIHHTSSQPGYRVDFMNITHLLNIYASYYAEACDDRNEFVKGQPIWSNHSRNGKPSFLAYHWLMRMDGSFERLLDDSQIGWHAGNWDINRRSIGICLDNDYENQSPEDEILRKLASHIKQTYPGTRVIGHCEARSGTICPGTNFLDGWKDNLLSYLR